MALIYDSRWRSIDSSGNPYSGATLTVYTAGTTTLASVYSDAALTVPLTNPVTADSAGRFPQIFAEEGALFDILEKTSGGVLIASYEDMSSLGSDTGSLTRDFTTSRFAARADGGTVRVEAGDASPDNTGGTMELGGWNGTQADSITLDGALIDTTGRIKEIGKKLTGVVSTEATSFSAASSVDITLPNDPTGVRIYELEIFDFFAVSNGNIGLRLNFGAGFLSGATDYTVHVSLLDSSTTTAVANGVSSGAYYKIADNAAGATNKPGHFIIRIITADSGNYATRIKTEGRYINSTGNHIMEDTTGFAPASQGRCTAIRIFGASGIPPTISGKYILRTLRGSGDA